MARAAVEQSSPTRPEASILELENTVWLQPIVVAEHKQVSIALSVEENGHVGYEIYTNGAEQRVIHCQGRALFSHRSAPPRLDIHHLMGQMDEGRLEAPYVYARFAEMGLNYGPAHQGISAIYQGKKQILAQLRLPSLAGAKQHDYVLHPSLMDSALQASMGLIVDWNRALGRPNVPFALDSLCILSACTSEMFAWARYSEGSHLESRSMQLDIDLCDPLGNVCVQMRGIASRVLDSAGKSTHKDGISHLNGNNSTALIEDNRNFDKTFYENLLSDILSHKVLIEEAAELG
jgi:acyl transferase domain-containing protein